MKIGIIVHSHTGNTYSVAQRLKEKLLADGHSADLEQIMAVNDKQTEAGKIQLKSIPDVGKYDVLVFGAPVRGGSVSPVMAAYLTQLSSLSDKKVICFVTQLFPSPTMGGNRSIEQMTKICESKGVRVCRTGIVNWSNLRRKKIIDDMVEEFSRMF